MYKLPESDGIVIMPVGLVLENGKTIPGETTNEIINRLFGELLPTENRALTPGEFQAIVDYCADKQWNAWELSWKQWHKDGLV